ncbi:hypothetical protein K501DRAFT_206420 [Backusella circina FSU 941]|nr:hypothetical protein K501DRAFT_264157 [Backusella circina FSU 941]KAI8890470.1 hypothetical protein K501DRAFT_206420 [Backusella circina FSU 941]
MPLSIATSYEEIGPNELAVLQRLYERSNYDMKAKTIKPTKLAIYDFDSTLFFSPLLSPVLWNPKVTQAVTAEGIYGPGWWRDIRSLDLGSPVALEANGWEGFWNESVVASARKDIADPNTMTIVLTGRRYHPFHKIVPIMLRSKNLDFDLVGLRPDPESISEHHWEVTQDGRLIYDLAGSVFISTMHFKTCFILYLLHSIPSLAHVVMWDDRIHHVRRFEEYLKILQGKHIIKSERVVFIQGVRPNFNPKWEKKVVSHIINTYNTALREAKEGVKRGKVKYSLEWDELDEKVETVEMERLLKIVNAPYATVIQIDQSGVDWLHQAFESKYQQLVQNGEEEGILLQGGEKPVFFGDKVYLSQRVLHKDKIEWGDIGTQVSFKVDAISVFKRMSCIVARVTLSDQQEYVLPLWFKPSLYNEIFKRQCYWTKLHHNKQRTLTGKIAYACRYDIEGPCTRGEKRKNISSDNRSRKL